MKWCDVHQVYFEFDEYGWPNCDQGQRTIPA
jgi:hypothetical protein